MFQKGTKEQKSTDLGRVRCVVKRSLNHCIKRSLALWYYKGGIKYIKILSAQKQPINLSKGQKLKKPRMKILWMNMNRGTTTPEPSKYFKYGSFFG